MSLSDMPTLADMNATRRAIQKQDVPTKIERAIEKKAISQLDQRKLRAWAIAVKVRDDYHDRHTGKPVKGTREADPDRAEAHHVVSRSDLAVRYDVRNGITLSMRTHDLVERNQLRIVGTKWFNVKGQPQKYINASKPVRFEVVT